MRGATRVSLQLQQVLRLPGKITLVINPLHTWNAIYNARRNKCHCPNSPNTAPATKNESHDWSLSHMKRYLQCAEQHVSLSKLTKYWACHEKWISCLILVTHETLFTMRGGTSVIVQTHQILRLPRKMNLMIDPCHTWNAIYNARSNKCHCPNSPNTAPATKNESHDWSLSHMKRYLQCAEQQVSLSKLTKYCACHAKWRSKILQKFLENSWNVISNAGPIREWSEQDPRMIRTGSENETVTPQPASQARLLFTPTTSILYWKIQHFALRLSFQISPNTAPATKSDTSTSPNTAPATKNGLMIDPCHTWNAIYNARSNKCHCPNSPNTAPATKNESHDWSLSHMKGYLQCAEQQVSLSKLTKYCACHEKWISWLILVTHETLFTMRGATSVLVQTHQILRLPRKMTLQNFAKISRKQLKRHFQCGADPRMIREWSELDPTMKPSSATRLATEVTFHDHHDLFVLKITTFRAPAINLNFTECCACHEKWHFNFTKYCPCHEKWISWLILVTHETLFTMRGATSVIVQTHQILRLPRKMNLMIDPCHTWKAIYNVQSNKCHCPNSPNTAPATKNESHDWSLSHMKRYLQCAEQQVSLSKLPKYCACHAKWLSKILQKFLENSWIKRHFQCGADPRMIREWSELDPTMKPSSATRLATEVTFHDHHDLFVLKITTFRAPAIILNFTKCCACHEKWQFNITKYCACHEKCHLNVTK